MNGAAAVEGEGAMAEPGVGHATGQLPPVQAPDRPGNRRRGLQLTTGELISVIGLVAGGIVWLSHVSLTAGSLSTRLENVEKDGAASRAALVQVQSGVQDLRVGIEQRGADLRERLARIEAMLAAAADKK